MKIVCTIKLLCFLFILSSLAKLQAQSPYIIAGQHGINDYYHYVDSSFYAQSDFGATTLTWNIDINGDGVNDFELYAHSVSALGGSGGDFHVISLSGSEIAAGVIDTCDYAFSMAKPFVINDSINKGLKWSSATQNFYEYNYTVNGYGNCTVAFTSTDTTYIGIKTIAGTDTLYGWLRMANVGAGCTLIDYACDRTLIKSGSGTIGWPNPSNGIFTIESPASAGQFTVEVFNVLGQKVYMYSLPQVQGFVQVDISNRPNGIYLYRITSQSNGGVIGEGKLVKAK